MKKQSPLKAIREACLECSAGSSKEVKLCIIPNCALFSYRFGKNPNRKGIGGKGNPNLFKKTSVNCEKTENKTILEDNPKAK